MKPGKISKAAYDAVQDAVNTFVGIMQPPHPHGRKSPHGVEHQYDILRLFVTSYLGGYVDNLPEVEPVRLRGRVFAPETKEESDDSTMDIPCT